MDKGMKKKCLYAIGGGGFILNCLLLQLILTDKARIEDGYRKILLITTTYNIYYSLISSIADFGFVIDEFGYIVFSKNLYELGYVASEIGIFGYSVAFMVSLNLLAVHCFYRYVKITGKYSFFFEKRRYIAGIIAGMILFAILYHVWCSYTLGPTSTRNNLSRTYLRAHYDINIDELAYIGGMYKTRNPETGAVQHLYGPMIGPLLCTTSQFALCFAIGYLCVKLSSYVGRSTCSDNAKVLHYQLLRLLTIQALAPLLFEYAPAFTALWGSFIVGLFGIDIGFLAFYIPLLIACYPTVDALMVIFGFTAYRKRVLNLFGYEKKSIAEVTLEDTQKTNPQP